MHRESTQPTEPAPEGMEWIYWPKKREWSLEPAGVPFRGLPDGDETDTF